MSYWSDKRVVVTGGGGFLGTHVVEALRAAGCRHVFVVRSRDHDLTREDSSARLFADLAAGAAGWPGGKPAADVVIHLAGLVGGIQANKDRPADFFYANLMMGVLTMHNSWKAGARKFIAAAAGCGYPENAPQPLSEQSFWDGFPQQESAPYSLAKRMLHVQSIAYWRQHRFPAIVVLPGNIYGPHDNFDLENAHVIPALVRKFVEATERQPHGDVVVWGSGRASRDFVYAGDVASGILRAGEVCSEPQLLNLSMGRQTSVKDVVSLLGEITEFKGNVVWDPARPEGQTNRCMDVGKARRELGFECATDLRAGLALTVRWYRENRDRARNVEVPRLAAMELESSP
jgi:GDP-L-fucose synthase